MNRAGFAYSLLLAVAIVAASSLPFGATVQAGEEGAKSLAHRISELSLLNDAAEAWRRLLLSQHAANSCACSLDAETSQKINKAWEGAVQTGFNTAKMADDIEMAYAAALSPDEMKTLIAFYESDAGRRISAADKASLETPDPAKFKAEFAAAKKQLAGDRKRFAVLSDISTANGGVDAQIDALAVVSIGSSIGSMNALPQGTLQPDNAPLGAILQAQRTALRAALGPVVLPLLARAYARVPFADLKAYAALLSSPVGRKFSLLSRYAAVEALRRQAISVGTSFARRMTATSS